MNGKRFKVYSSERGFYGGVVGRNVMPGELVFVLADIERYYRIFSNDRVETIKKILPGYCFNGSRCQESNQQKSNSKTADYASKNNS